MFDLCPRAVGIGSKIKGNSKIPLCYLGMISNLKIIVILSQTISSRRCVYICINRTQQFPVCKYSAPVKFTYRI